MARGCRAGEPLPLSLLALGGVTSVDSTAEPFSGSRGLVLLCAGLLSVLNLRGARPCPCQLPLLIHTAAQSGPEAFSCLFHLLLLVVGFLLVTGAALLFPVLCMRTTGCRHCSPDFGC